MTDALAGAGAGLAWLGATLLALSDGRRGMALSVAVTATGLAAGIAAAGAAPAAVVVLLAGGACAAAACLRGPAPAWGLLPPGSTPRLIGSIVVLMAALALGGSSLSGPAGLARLGGLVVIVLAAGRLLTAGGRWPVLAAGSALALGLGSLGGTAALGAGAVAAVALALVGANEPARAKE